MTCTFVTRIYGEVEGRFCGLIGLRSACTGSPNEKKNCPVWTNVLSLLGILLRAHMLPLLEARTHQLYLRCDLEDGKMSKNRERCEDKECPCYGEPLVDRGYAYPVCPSTEARDAEAKDEF